MASFQADCSEHIHIHSPHILGALALEIGHALHIPIVATSHFMPINLSRSLADSGALSQSFSRWFYRYLVGFYHRCDYVTAPTITALTLLREHGLRTPGEAIRNGVDLARFSPGPREEALRQVLGLPRGRPLVLILTRLMREKRVHVLWEAVAQTQEPFHLAIAGSGPDAGPLQTLANQLGISRKISFLGFVADESLVSLYRLADLFVMPSIAELQSLATLQALACGLPVINAEAGVLPELVQPGQNGALFQPDQSDQLALCLDTLLRQPQQWQTMGLQSLRIVAHHDDQRVIEHDRTMGNNLSKLDTKHQDQKPPAKKALLQEEHPFSSLLGKKGKQRRLWERANALKTRLLAPGAILRHPLIALRLPLVFILLFCESAWQIFLAPTDVARYQCYALTFWFGSRAATWLPAAKCAFLSGSSPQPAFHLLPLEYPPVTVLFFSLPLLVPLPYYSLAFALLMLLIVGIVYRLLETFHSQKAAWCFLLYLGLGASVLVQVRFDLLPAACMLICLIAADRKRWGIAYSALAIGALSKLYPIIALPALFNAEQHASGALAFPSISNAAEGRSWFRRQIRWPLARWRWKHLGLFSAIMVGVSGCFALLNLQAAIDGPLNYLIERPTQIESLQSSLLWLAHYAGIPLQIVFTYGSLNSISPLAGALSWSGTALCIIGNLCIFRLQWQQKLSLGQTMIALLCLLVTTGKVFSPQYLIWLIPLIAYVGAARLWLHGWGILSLATTGIYIFYYSHLPDPETAVRIIQSLPGFFEVVSLRNAACCLLTLAYLFNWFEVRQVPPR